MYPAKRTLSAMRKHGGWGPFAGYHRIWCLCSACRCDCLKRMRAFAGVQVNVLKPKSVLNILIWCQAFKTYICCSRGVTKDCIYSRKCWKLKHGMYVAIERNIEGILKFYRINYSSYFIHYVCLWWEQFISGVAGIFSYPFYIGVIKSKRYHAKRIWR